jgi:hypothetical protein
MFLLQLPHWLIESGHRDERHHEGHSHHHEGHSHHHGHSHSHARAPVDSVNWNTVFITTAVGLFSIVVFFGYLCADKSSRERPLLQKIGALDKEVYQLRNENLAIKKESEQALKEGRTPASSPIRDAVSAKVNEDLAKELQLVKVRPEYCN